MRWALNPNLLRRFCVSLRMFHFWELVPKLRSVRLRPQWFRMLTALMRWEHLVSHVHFHTEAINRLIYDPAVLPVMHPDFQEYKKSLSPTINHFYEKLLLLKDRMNTETARIIAEERHQFMEDYLVRFFEEWEATR